MSENTECRCAATAPCYGEAIRIHFDDDTYTTLPPRMVRPI